MAKAIAAANKSSKTTAFKKRPSATAASAPPPKRGSYQLDRIVTCYNCRVTLDPGALHDPRRLRHLPQRLPPKSEEPQLLILFKYTLLLFIPFLFFIVFFKTLFLIFYISYRLFPVIIDKLNYLSSPSSK